MSTVELSADGVGVSADMDAYGADAGGWKIEVAGGGDAERAGAGGGASSASVRDAADETPPHLSTPSCHQLTREATVHMRAPPQAVLAKPAFRTRLLNELLELRAFLAQRRSELRSSPGAVRAPSSLARSAPAPLSPVEKPPIYASVPHLPFSVASHAGGDENRAR